MSALRLSALAFLAACSQPWTSADSGLGYSPAPGKPGCVVHSLDLAMEGDAIEARGDWTVYRSNGDSKELVQGTLTVTESTQPCYVECDQFVPVKVAEVVVVEGEEFRLGPVPARPGHLYQANFESRCDDRASFLVLAPLTPLEDPQQVVGQTYASPGDTFELSVDLGLFQDEMTSVLHMVWLPLLEVDLVDGEDLQATIAWPDITDPDTPAQKVCTSTTSLSGVFTNPGFVTDRIDLTVVTGMGSTRVYNTEIRGDFVEDGDAIAHVEFSGLFDLRDLAPEFGMSVGEVCQHVEDLSSLACTRCPDGVPYCLFMGASQVVANARDVSIQRGSDVCGIEGDLARWDYELGQIHTAERGSDVVRALDFEGNLLWQTQVAEPVTTLQYDFIDEDRALLIVHDPADGGGIWWRVDKQTLETTGAWPIADLPVEAAGGDIVPMSGGGYGSGGMGVGLEFFPGFMFPIPVCSIVSVALGSLPGWAILIPMLGALVRRERN